jgi:DNA-binding IclR family transcriptional regulator
VPILNFAGHAVGAISIAGTSAKVEGPRLEALAERIKSAGEYLSRRLGFLVDGHAHSD